VQEEASRGKKRGGGKNNLDDHVRGWKEMQAETTTGIDRLNALGNEQKK